MAGQQQSIDPDFDPLSILRTSRAFRHLKAAELKELAALGRMERYDQRTLLVQRGTVPRYIRYVINGGVEIKLTTRGGREAQMPPTRADDWATMVGCFVDEPLPFDLWAAPASTLLAFPIRAVQSALSTNAAALFDILTEFGAAACDLISMQLAVYLTSDEQRLCNIILCLSKSLASKSPGSLRANVTQSQIAELGFGTRQRVSKLLKNLEARGLVELQRRSVSIVSPVRMRDFASNYELLDN